MENKESEKYLGKAIEWVQENKSAILFGSIVGFALTAAYFIKSNKKGRSRIEPPKFDITMERYIFDIPTDEGSKQAIVEAGGECYGITLDNKYIGSMWRDENKGLQWETNDHSLEPYIWEIARKLSEAFSREGFPSLLRGTYSEIKSTDWKTSETLEVTVSKDTDLDVFSAFLRDEILNLVDFEEHLDLIVKKADDQYFVIVGIN